MKISINIIKMYASMSHKPKEGVNSWLINSQEEQYNAAISI